MKQIYDVTLLIDASAGVRVEAESPQEAAEMAEMAAANKGAGDLCHQCSDHTETGDFIGAIVYDEAGQEVLDTSRTSELEAKLKAIKPAVVQIREAMETAAGRGDDAELHIGNCRLKVTYHGIKWHHWQIGLARSHELSIEEFDEILAKELAPC